MAARSEDPGTPTPPARPGGAPDALERKVLVYASALGRELDFALLVEATGADEESLVEAVERLVARGIFRELAGGDRFAFAQDERRVQVYRGLTPSRLRIVHRKIAEAMERRYAPPSPELVAELGRHFFLGRVPEKSYAYNLEAADRAEEAGAKELAALHLERVRLDRGSVPKLSPETEGRLAERLARLYYDLGDYRAAARLFAEGLEGTPSGDLPRQAELWVARARVARELRDLPAAIAAARRAESLYERLEDGAGLALVHRTLGRLAFDRGRYREALEEGMVALDLLAETEDPATVGRLSVELGNAFARLGPEVTEEAVVWFDRAIPLLAAAKDAAGLAEAYRERGRALAVLRPSEALEDLARSRAAAASAQDGLAEAWSLLESVPIRLTLGQVDEAERDNQLAEQLVADRDAPEARQRAQANAGVLNERQGRWEEAEAAYRRSLELARRIGDEPNQAEVQYQLARLFVKTHDLPKARAAHEAAARLSLAAVRPALAEAFEELGRQLEEAARSPPSTAGPASPSTGP